MKNVKKLVALSLAAVLSLSLAACGGGKTAPAESETPENTPAPVESQTSEATPTAEAKKLNLVSEGKLTVATCPDFAPFEFYTVDSEGKPQIVGSDMALAKYVADSMGLELEVVPMEFDGVLMSVQTKTVDVGISGLSATPSRASIMDFSTLYCQSGQSFVTIKGNEDKFPTVESLNDPSLTVGAQTASLQVELAQQYSASADLIQLPKVTEIIGELLAGKLDGAYIETAVAESYAMNYPDLVLVQEIPYHDAEGYAIGVVKDNPELLAAVNEAVEAALADGSIDKFMAEAAAQANSEAAAPEQAANQ